MPLSDLLGWVTVVVELAGGLIILRGALVPLISIPMIVVLLVATVTVHRPNGFSSIKLVSYDALGAHFGQPGYETDLLYLDAYLKAKHTPRIVQKSKSGDSACASPTGSCKLD